MDFAAALAHLYALTPELAAPRPLPDGTLPPRRKFDLAHMRTLAAALGDPQTKLPVRPDRRHQRQRLDRRHARLDPRLPPACAPASTPARTSSTSRAHPAFAGRHLGADLQMTTSPSLYTLVDDTARSPRPAPRSPLRPQLLRAPHRPRLPLLRRQRRHLVLEVGLGGRLDATNIVEPLVSVITDIALDHQEYLGDTIAQIAREKCGILRPHGTLVTLPSTRKPTRPSAKPPPRSKSAASTPPTSCPGPTQLLLDIVILRQRRRTCFFVVIPRRSRGTCFSPAQPIHPRLEDPTEPGLLEVDSPLPGNTSSRNLALAIAAAIELREPPRSTRIPNAAIAEGIRNTRWPGRLEFLAPNLLLDVAHNPAGAWTLRAALSALPPDRPRTLLFSCLKDKDLTEMSRILFPLFDSSLDGDPARRRDHIVLAPIANPRAASVDDLLAAAHALGIPAHAAPHLAGALAQARAITPPGGLIVATGSVYLVGEIRQLILGDTLSAEARPA